VLSSEWTHSFHFSSLLHLSLPQQNGPMFLSSYGRSHDRKPPSAPPMTSATGLLPPNPDATSSSSPTPLPHPVFTDVQRETILALCQDNAEMKFRQELMEKRLDWILDSGAQDPTQRRTTKELLQQQWSQNGRTRLSMLSPTTIQASNFHGLLLFVPHSLCLAYQATELSFLLQ
jgi:hypothetical protein